MPNNLNIDSERRLFLKEWLGNEDFDGAWPDHYTHAFTGWMASIAKQQRVFSLVVPPETVTWNSSLLPCDAATLLCGDAMDRNLIALAQHNKCYLMPFDERGSSAEFRERVLQFGRDVLAMVRK